MKRTSQAASAVVALCLIAATHAGAITSPSDRCEISKLKAAAKACACRHKTAAKAMRNGHTPDFSACAAGLSDAFAKAEARAAGQCPNESEGTVVDGRLAALEDDVATALEAASAMESDAIRCVAAKLSASGKDCACILKAQAKAVRTGNALDFTKCDDGLTGAFSKTEVRVGAACPTTSDAGDIGFMILTAFREVEADIANLGTDHFSTRGPFPVGVKTLTLVDSSRATPPNGPYGGAPDRTLVVDVWYPATGDPLQAQIINAPFAENTGPLPLMLRAHGFSGFRSDSKYITQHLASHGYVVVSPDFPLSYLGAPGGPTLADVDQQALDLGFLIDSFDAMNNDSGSFFYGKIYIDAIGAIGHSLGGATVLLATYHRDVRDSRIDATVAFSPLACVFLDGFYDSVPTPLMIQGGTVDMITPYTSNQLTPYSYVNAPRYLLELTGGTHLGFSDRLLFGPGENGDDEVGCALFVQEGDPRPVTIDSGLPPDYLGGEEAYVDPSGSQCEPICPYPPPSFMLHARQNKLAKAGSLSFFESKLRGSIAGGRMITGKIDDENADAVLFFDE